VCSQPASLIMCIKAGCHNPGCRLTIAHMTRTWAHGEARAAATLRLKGD
jgi:hypothetical protein